MSRLAVVHHPPGGFWKIPETRKLHDIGRLYTSNFSYISYHLTTQNKSTVPAPLTWISLLLRQFLAILYDLQWSPLDSPPKNSKSLHNSTLVSALKICSPLTWISLLLRQFLAILYDLQWSPLDSPPKNSKSLHNSTLVSALKICSPLPSQ